MANWNNMPHEIVLHIVEYLKHNTYHQQWMFTNKELHEAYQSFFYNHIYINLQDTSDKIVDAVLDSVLEPGKDTPRHCLLET